MMKVNNIKKKKLNNMEHLNESISKALNESTGDWWEDFQKRADVLGGMRFDAISKVCKKIKIPQEYKDMMSDFAYWAINYVVSWAEDEDLAEEYNSWQEFMQNTGSSLGEQIADEYSDYDRDDMYMLADYFWDEFYWEATKKIK